MEGEEGGGLGIRLNKDKGGEVDYKSKAGTAWSHSYLNQKPWHPLSYPNQRRKWIAEQTHANHHRRAQEVAREYAQEQEFFRQTALISKKEKEKVEMMKAVSFMYVRPPGYNAESAKAAEIADEKKSQHPLTDDTIPIPPQSVPKDPSGEEKKKPRPKDVFGRALPTEEEFEVLKNAPRMETGVLGRVKPFGVEVRNVKCLRCGNYGHQSGDRECPLKDAIMPNEESRLKRDDPLNAILAHTDPTEPLKWELKQKPGISPPRGGFKPDDPNQQIVAEDIFDEYGGFLSGGVPELLLNFSSKPKKKESRKKNKRKQQSPSGRKSKDPYANELSSEDGERTKNKKSKMKKEKRSHSESSLSDSSEFDRRKKNRHTHSYLSEDSDADRHCRSKKSRHKHSYSSEDSDIDRHHRSDKSRPKQSCLSEYSDLERHRSDKSIHRGSYLSEDSDLERHHGIVKSRHKHSYSSDDADPGKHHRGDKSRHKHPHSSEDSNCERHHRSKRSRQKQSYSSEDSDVERHRRSNRSMQKQSYSSKDSDSGRHHRIDKSRNKSSHSLSFEDSDKGHRRSKYHGHHHDP